MSPSYGAYAVFTQPIEDINNKAAGKLRSEQIFLAWQ